MRKILLFVAITIISFQIFGQVDPIRQKLDSVFQHVDKSQIPTGYLKEYGAEFMPLHWFNGVITDSNTVADIDAFRFIYDDIATAKIQQNLPVMTDLLVLNAKIDSLRSASMASAIALLYGNYASLRDDALSLNLFTISNQQIYDVPGRIQSPYNTNTLFAAASINKTFTDTVSFTYKPVLYFSNTGITITQLSVDFKDGQGYKIIPVNGTVSKTYIDSSSTKMIDFRAKLSTGTYVHCHSSVDVFVTNTGVGSRYAGNDPYARDVPVPVVLGEGLGGDMMQIRYSVNNPTRTNPTPRLRKPLIYVEGYDVSGEYNIMNLISQNIQNPGEWVKLEQDYDFMHYLDDVAGYDLVFVNYNTLRSFEDNSKMLQHVIEWVKADKTAGGYTEKNVVLGVSAGGVLARYTLARMTKNISPASTDTRLLITHDSPHQGANVPLAFQHFLYDLGNMKILGIKIKDKMEELENFFTLNTQPATAQLLRARVVDENGTVAMNTFLNGPNSPYQQMIKFAPTGNQPIYRFIATAQGSQCGIPVMASNGLSLADFDGEFAFARFKLVYIPTPAKTKYFLKTRLKALPSSGMVAEIEYFKYSRRFSFFGIGFGTKTIKEKSRNNPTGFTNWDSAPGSTESINARTDGSLTTGLNKQNVPWYYTPFVRIKAGLDMNISQDLFSFVSTTSALDAPVGTPLNTVYIFPVTGLASTSVQEYIAQEQFSFGSNTYFNQNHTDFTARNAEWIYDEMQGISNNLNCSNECGGGTNSITGSESVCSSPSSYTLNTIPGGTTITWSVLPANIVNGPNPIVGPQTTLEAIGSGTVTLTANMTNTCGVLPPIHKTVKVGLPDATNLVLNHQFLCTDYPIEFAVEYDEFTYCSLLDAGITDVEWGISSPNTYTVDNSNPLGCSYVSNSGKMIYFSPDPFNNPYTAEIRVRVLNSCGWSDWKYFPLTMEDCGGGGWMFTASPNPANNIIDITLNDQTVKNNKSMVIREIQITNKLGNIVKQIKLEPNATRYSLNISALKQDVYFIRLFNGKEWKSQSIIKQ